MNKFCSSLVILVVALCLVKEQANSEEIKNKNKLIYSALVADLSEDLIAITTRFTGTEVLLFGATNGIGDIIVVVRAPNSEVTVRQKGRVGGVWINKEGIIFNNVPGFYHLASSRPIDELLPQAVLKKEQIGAENLSVVPVTAAHGIDISSYKKALIRNKKRSGLYNTQPGKITFLSNRLFKTSVDFPSSVPIGKYSAVVYLVDNGTIIDRTKTPLQVQKTGFEAKVFEFANNQPSYYGIVAVVIALFAGWLASVMFRNV
ncbi:MAG: hypothetical protein CL568_01490 [Alphaproteobacteria bacterium]|nr:hypothetical protein [Alphaproteobacteria bacterium]PPR13452.1 MAG: hypothetical protein CFH42_01204 [Alphaproteobacteria bacterium MarineAlpha12_Bin1]|tara:strand:+ start:8547 stop:9326 length:780 start_codon:yes stop_codon:yes gene_type:complete